MPRRSHPAIPVSRQFAKLTMLLEDLHDMAAAGQARGLAEAGYGQLADRLRAGTRQAVLLADSLPQLGRPTRSVQGARLGRRVSDKR